MATTKQTVPLIQQSFRIMRHHKKLLVFPLISSIAAIILFSLIITPILKFEQHQITMTGSSPISLPYIFILLLVIFFFCHFFIVLSNTALLATSEQYCRGAQPTLKRGFNIAGSCFIQLLIWTLINTTLGIIIRLVVSWSDQWANSKFVQTWLAGLPWTIGIYFVIPLIAFNQSTALSAIKQSSHMLRDTWGTQMTPHFGLGIRIVIARLIALLPIALGLYEGTHQLIILGSAMTLLLFLLISLISALARMMTCVVLYLFATEGYITPGFAKADLVAAF